jgi:hypothetical protein
MDEQEIWRVTRASLANESEPTSVFKVIMPEDSELKQVATSDTSTVLLFSDGKYFFKQCLLAHKFGKFEFGEFQKFNTKIVYYLHKICV